MLIDRSDLLDLDLPGDPLDRILHFLTRSPVEPEDGAETEGDEEEGRADGSDTATTKASSKTAGRPPARRPEPGWLVPVAVGYQALESYDEKRLRKGTRDAETAHLFVEDLIGIAELVSSRSFARRLRAGHGAGTHFWKWRIDLDRGEFLVSASS